MNFKGSINPKQISRYRNSEDSGKGPALTELPGGTVTVEIDEARFIAEYGPRARRTGKATVANGTVKIKFIPNKEACNA